MRTKLVLVLVCIVLLITVGVVYDRTQAVGNDPGSIADPLVTKSYVDEMNTKLLAQVEQRISGTSTGGNTTPTTPTNMTEIYKYIDDKLAGVVQNGGTSTPSSFIVVEVAAGQKLICDGGTELILRGGEAMVVANSVGDGLSDVTTGNNVSGGVLIQLDHLVVVPRTDGRGLSISKKSYIMVKGDYVIQ